MVPQRSADEQLRLLDEVRPLTNDQKREILREAQLPRNGNKADLEDRIASELEAGNLSPDIIVDHLDRIVPWWKFHAFLYSTGDVPRQFQSLKRISKHLEEFELDHLLDEKVRLALPEQLTLSSIEWSNTHLQVTAVRRRTYTERDESLDNTEISADGEEIEFRAFVHQVKRGVIVLDWHLDTKTATLRISELPSGISYENVRDEFFRLIKDWLSPNLFTPVDISSSIAELHRIEEGDSGEVRSHGIEYETVEGRRLLGRSPTSEDSVLGEPVIDTALHEIREVGSGRGGNFYWLSTFEGPVPLSHDIHMIIVGHKSRAAFRVRHTTASTPDEMTHVLRRLRELSHRPPTSA